MDMATPKLELSLDRLIKFMRLTTSDNDGEALAAARAANALLKRLNTDWDDILRSKVSIIADPFGDIPVVKQSPTPPPDSPKPTSASPWASTTRPSYTPPPPPPPRKPPPPAFPKSKEIDGWFAMLSLRTYSTKITQQISAAKARYVHDQGLTSADYMYIKNLASKQGLSSIGDL